MAQLRRPTSPDPDESIRNIIARLQDLLDHTTFRQTFQELFDLFTKHHGWQPHGRIEDILDPEVIQSIRARCFRPTDRTVRRHVNGIEYDSNKAGGWGLTLVQMLGLFGQEACESRTFVQALREAQRRAYDLGVFLPVLRETASARRDNRRNVRRTKSRLVQQWKTKDVEDAMTQLADMRREEEGDVNQPTNDEGGKQTDSGSPELELPRGNAEEPGPLDSGREGHADGTTQPSAGYNIGKDDDEQHSHDPDFQRDKEDGLDDDSGYEDFVDPPSPDSSRCDEGDEEDEVERARGNGEHEAWDDLGGESLFAENDLNFGENDLVSLCSENYSSTSEQVRGPGKSKSVRGTASHFSAFARDAGASTSTSPHRLHTSTTTGASTLDMLPPFAVEQLLRLYAPITVVVVATINAQHEAPALPPLPPLPSSSWKMVKSICVPLQHGNEHFSVALIHLQPNVGPLDNPRISVNGVLHEPEDQVSEEELKEDIKVTRALFNTLAEKGMASGDIDIYSASHASCTSEGVCAPNTCTTTTMLAAICRMHHQRPPTTSDQAAAGHILMVAAEALDRRVTRTARPDWNMTRYTSPRDVCRLVRAGIQGELIQLREMVSLRQKTCATLRNLTQTHIVLAQSHQTVLRLEEEASDHFPGLDLHLVPRLKDLEDRLHALNVVEGVIEVLQRDNKEQEDGIESALEELPRQRQAR